MDALLATTALGGEIMARPDDIGKIQPGYFADVILVNGNPLEDISLLSNHENINVVIMVSYGIFIIPSNTMLSMHYSRRMVVYTNSLRKMVKYGMNRLEVCSMNQSAQSR